MKRILPLHSFAVCLTVTKRIALSVFVIAFAIFLNAASPKTEAVQINGGVNQAKGLWVFGGSVVPNPVSTAAGRNRLTELSSADGVSELYVSVYQSTLSTSGRQMYQDADMAQLNTAAHGKAQQVWAAYGDVNWPTLGCTPTSFPVLRMQEVAAFNTANPSARFDGVMLDVEPNPDEEAEFQALLSHFQCMRSNLPASIKLGAAISSFWDLPVAFPVGGPTKPAYQHIIDLNLDSVVVMGYRDTAGTGTCPASNGLICLDKDEIVYASSIGKTGLVLVGLETLNVAPGQPASITFFEEGVGVMNAQAQLAATHFAAESGFGGFAIHNYNAEYLRGTSGFPIPSIIGACSTGQNVDVEATGGTLSQGYATLKSAFDAINLGTHTGTISIEICGSTDELSTPAVLNSTGAGSANYSSITIYPLADALSILGAPPTGRGLIELNGTDNVSIDGDNPLTMGTNRDLTLQNTAANTTTYGQVIRIALNTTTVNTANGCVIKNLDVVGHATGRNISTATSGTASENTSYGIYVSGNAAGATTAPLAISSTGTTVGTGATATNLTISNNRITTAARGISIQGSAQTVFPGLVIENNIVGNPAAGAVDQVYSMGISAQGSTNALLRSNVVYVESFLLAALRGIDLGSVNAAGTGSIVEKNTAGRVRNNRPQTNGAYGINLGGGNNHIVRNNFVTDIRNDQTTGGGAFSTTEGAFGIRVGLGTGHKVLHNSIHLSGSVPAGTTGSTLTAALLVNGTGNTGLDIRNNIFSNQLTGGNPTGIRHAAVYLPTTATATMNVIWNNNAYYQGGDANSRIAQVGLTIGSGDYLAANFDSGSITPATNFRSYTSGISSDGANDNSSFASTASPPFVSNTDLHVLASTMLESAGANVGVADDIDGETRTPATPDIGADEFASVPPDVTVPVIAYTPLGSSAGTANRVLAVTVSDNVAVASGGVGPRIYFRKGAGAYSSTQCVMTGGTAQNGTYDCTIDNALLGGVTADDVVSYFVVAQDTSGNVASNPAGVDATNVNNIITPPPTTNSYAVDPSGALVVNDEDDGPDANPGNGICEVVPGSGICTLEAAIIEANALAGNDVITFAANISQVNATATLPAVTTTMTIQGPAEPLVEIIGDSSSRIFDVTGGGNFTLVNLFVQDGLAVNGAGLRNQSGGTVTLSGCQFRYNVATDSGGGIFNEGSMTINSSSINENRADTTGAGIYNGIGASLTINDSNVNNNDNDPSTGRETDLTEPKSTPGKVSNLGLTNRGGGIENRGTLNINRSLIFGNVTLGSGGGLDNQLGTATLNNTTVSMNSALTGIGGGIDNGSDGTLNLNNSTVAGQNMAANDGGGVMNEGTSTANVRSSIIAGNTSPTSPDVSGTYATPSYNLIGKSDGSAGFAHGTDFNIVGTSMAPVNPVLGALADNGGPTFTHAVLPNSPALDKGNSFGSVLDQRGVNRTFNISTISDAADGTDIGSFERTAPTAADTSLSGRISNTLGQGIRNIRVTISGGNLAEGRTALTGTFGYFRFDGLRAGETYIVTVSGKRYVFTEPSRVVTLFDEAADVDFVGRAR